MITVTLGNVLLVDLGSIDTGGLALAFGKYTSKSSTDIRITGGPADFRVHGDHFTFSQFNLVNGGNVSSATFNFNGALLYSITGLNVSVQTYFTSGIATFLQGSDKIIGNNGNNILFSYTGNDIISGGPGKDNINGNEGNDTLSGGPGEDFIQGSLGSDKISGGLGVDSLSGSLGRDFFTFDVKPLTKNRDTINDFENGFDVIKLLKTEFTKLPKGALPDALFVIGNKAIDGNDFVIFNPTIDRLFYDPDGKGIAPQVLLATLSNFDHWEPVELTARDVIVYA